MSDLDPTLIHIASPWLTVQTKEGTLLRQRCGWCGAVLIDVNLDRIAVAIHEGEEPGEYPRWETGALVAIDHGLSYLIEPQEVLPPAACAMLDSEVTA